MTDTDAAGPAERPPTELHREAGDPDGSPSGSGGGAAGVNRRRRGTRGGRGRSRSSLDRLVPGSANGEDDRIPELPDLPNEGRPSPEAAERALVRRPQIGDTRPSKPASASETGGSQDDIATSSSASAGSTAAPATTGNRRRRRRGGRNKSGGGGSNQPVRASVDREPIEIDEETLERRRGRERKGRAVGRYLMAVHVRPEATQIAVLEGRSLLEYYVSRPSDDVSQIHGNVYLGRVQNVLPGMEAAFVDIGTPKNAVLYRGDTRYDPEDVEEKGANLRIEEILKARQVIVCQATKNPIGAKGARLTQEVSLPGRFVVLVPNSSTYGISKRLAENERKRLRAILDAARPKGHGLIVRTAAEGVSAEEIERDIARLTDQWQRIEALAGKSQAPALLYREPDMAVRVIREEFNKDYRKVVIDDEALHDEVQDYVRSISPELAGRVELHGPDERLPIMEQFNVHEQLHKALDRKVWLPSGGSLIIERTEALTVIDVNTGKNVGTSSLEETVLSNNLEAADEVARQLRLRDIGGIIVIDFIDMEVRANRDAVTKRFREALARDKTRTQVFAISDLGLIEMTRKRIGEGLIESLSSPCPACDGRGMIFDPEVIGD
jgi:ribonuclease E